MPAKPTSETAAERSRRLILAAVRAIPAGQVAGYGEVARRAGLPGRARLVARVLAAGGEPGLPWHRVLRSDGRIAFPAGSAEFDEQVQRLRAEGVRIDAGRVRGQRAAATLDEMLWAPPEPEGLRMPAGTAKKTRPRPARPAAAAGTTRRR